MNNIIGNYQPDNELFRNLFFAVIMAITGIYYVSVKTFVHSDYTWYDYTAITAIAVLSLYFYYRSRVKSRSERRM